MKYILLTLTNPFSSHLRQTFHLHVKEYTCSKLDLELGLTWDIKKRFPFPVFLFYFFYHYTFEEMGIFLHVYNL